jgi:hypothetical protein
MTLECSAATSSLTTVRHLDAAAIEVRSAIRRRERAGDIDTHTAATIVESVSADLASTFI